MKVCCPTGKETFDHETTEEAPSKEADDEKHAPVCRRIMARLCGDDPAKWAKASAMARQCVEARIALWDAIAADIEAMP